MLDEIIHLWVYSLCVYYVDYVAANGAVTPVNVFVVPYPYPGALVAAPAYVPPKPAANGYARICVSTMSMCVRR
jgi:hypothetical protein